MGGQERLAIGTDKRLKELLLYKPTQNKRQETVSLFQLRQDLQ